MANTAGITTAMAPGAALVEAASMLIMGKPQLLPLRRPSIVGTRRCQVNSRPAPCPAQHYPPESSRSPTRLSVCSKDGQDTECRKHYCHGYADRSDRQLLGDPVPDEDSRNIREHHAEGRADDDRIELLEPCGKTDRGDLRLITDFRDEERTERRGERPRAADSSTVALVFVREQCPDCDAQK